MRYGFVIDQNRCIGCHACTVACKEEHQVPLGVFRTWVKYIEKGEFPHTQRHFGVLRCNHCDSAPCIEICPTKALFRRADGIVDFDGQSCIGCKSCMQACPYDALYLDPATQTAAKCNFCAHRVEQNLQPACVIVCPTQAILAGDLDQPASSVSRVVASEPVTVRKPHKGTQPKLFYLGVEGDLLEPARLSRQSSYLWSDRRDHTAASVAPALGPVREVYDVAHPRLWGWKISLYLWTKSIAAGVLMIAALLGGFVQAQAPGVSRLLNRISPLLALLMLAVTSVLLVWDLKRPERFYYLLTRSNFRSWLVIGAYILMLYGALSMGWLLEGFFMPSVALWLRWAAALLGLGSAGYSGFLFAQAKGRDLWLSPLFFWHLLAQAAAAGAASLILAIVFWVQDAGAGPIQRLLLFLLIGLVLNAVIIFAELALPHASEELRLAIQALIAGRLRFRFWILAVGLGLICPVLFLIWMLSTRPSWLGMGSVAAVALAGLWWFEELWIEAGQIVPLS